MAKELEVKNDKLQHIATKMIKVLFELDNKFDVKKAKAQDIESIMEAIITKSNALVKKSIREKKMNRKFQETMLKELENLNKILKEKKKKRNDRHSITRQRKKQQI